jgi:hypothetical protein
MFSGSRQQLETDSFRHGRAGHDEFRGKAGLSWLHFKSDSKDIRSGSCQIISLDGMSQESTGAEIVSLADG